MVIHLSVPNVKVMTTKARGSLAQFTSGKILESQITDVKMSFFLNHENKKARYMYFFPNLLFHLRKSV